MPQSTQPAVNLRAFYNGSHQCCGDGSLSGAGELREPGRVRAANGWEYRSNTRDPRIDVLRQDDSLERDGYIAFDRVYVHADVSVSGMWIGRGGAQNGRIYGALYDQKFELMAATAQIDVDGSTPEIIDADFIEAIDLKEGETYYLATAQTDTGGTAALSVAMISEATPHNVGSGPIYPLDIIKRANLNLWDAGPVSGYDQLFRLPSDWAGSFPASYDVSSGANWITDAPSNTRQYKGLRIGVLR